MTNINIRLIAKLACMTIVSLALTWTCKDDDSQPEPVAPAADVVDVLSVSKFTANVTSIITPGNLGIAEKGFCYNTTGEPTIDDDKKIVEEEVTIMAATLSGLLELTTYYVRAFVKTNDGSIVYSNRQSVFTTTFYQATTAVINSAKPFGNYIKVEILVISDSSSPIVRRGVLVSPSADRSDPDAQEFLDAENSRSTFVISPNGLNAETDYWLWAFVETEADGRVYAYSPVKATTTSSIWIKGQSVIDISGSSYKLTGAHRVHLDIQVSDTGDPGATLVEAGIIWSAESGIDLDTPGTSKRKDSRITGLDTYEVVAAPLKAGTKYYFKPYMINSKGSVTYGAEKSFTTRSENTPLFGEVFKFTVGNTGVNSPWSNGITYALRSSNMTTFQKTDPVVGADHLIEAFANDGDISRISFIFAKPGADSTVTSMVEHIVNSGDRAMFAWKLSYNESTSVMTLKDMIYKPENFPNLPTAPLDRRSYAKKLMDDPDTGPALAAYFEWITGTAGPRHVLLDWLTDRHSTANSLSFILMPLDEEVNPDLNYFRVGQIRWGTGAIGNVSLPVWD